MTQEEGYDFAVGDFVHELLWTDTVVWEVVRKTPHTLRLRRCAQGEPQLTVADGDDAPRTWYRVHPDEDGFQVTVRRRKHGEYRVGKHGNPIRPCPMLYDVPVRYVDYRY